MHNVVAIIGGGASGVLAASQVLLDRNCSVVLFEPGVLGRGMAYDTRCSRHLLNVPAFNMSAYADDPSHFLRWLEERYAGRYGQTSFVPRSIYGEYLGEIASMLSREYGRRFTHVRAAVEDITQTNDGITLYCSNGTSIEADSAILATGHSKRTRASALIQAPRYQGIHEPVVILGSGLTAIDAILSLRENGHRGSITLISTRGLLPHEHRIATEVPESWRSSIDALRPVTNGRWQAMSLVEQSRFLRHYASYWNVHRHRMAPEIAREIAQLLADRTLTVIAGRVRSVDETGNDVALTIRQRGSRDLLMLRFTGVIDCTGPEQDIRKSENRLMRSLLDRGYLTPHPLGVGTRVAEYGALIDVKGVASKRLYAIGPLRFGTLFETTAIPEIRIQAKELAHTLRATTPQLHQA